MKILVACEFSGVVREAFRKRGHNAVSCDLLPTEIPGKHYQGDVFDIIDAKWDLIIAHPPCTYISNAGARFLYPKGVLNQDRLKQGLEAKDFFCKLYQSNVERICIENPIPSTVYGLPPYSQVIQPYYFGDMVQKRTCLWLRNLPKLLYSYSGEVPQSTKIAGNWFNKGGLSRQKERARTFQGIANAMAEQWG
jgi:hypothetical protein